MPKNSSGVYSQPAGTEAVSGAVASSSDYNTLISDIASTLTGDLPRDGSAPMSSNLPMGGNNIIDVDGAAQRSHAAIGADLADGQFDWYGDQSGGNVGSVVDNGFAPAAYLNGFRIRARKVAANTGGFNMNVGSIGAEPVFKQTPAGAAALEGGEMPAGHLSIFEYDSNLDGGSGGWWLLNPNGDFQGKDAGIGLTVNGVDVNLDINGLSTVTTLNNNARVPIHDPTSGEPRNITPENLMKLINSMTTLADPAVDDLVALFDTSGSVARAMTLANLAKVLGLAEIETIAPTANQTEIEFTNIPSGRTALVMFIKGVEGDSTTQFRCAMSVNNGSSFLTARGGAVGTETGSAVARSAGATGQTNGTQITPDNVVDSDEIFGLLFFPNYSEASVKKWFVGITIADVNGGMGTCFSVSEATAAAINAIRLDFALGDFDAQGDVTLYSWG